jgi:membrane protease YdiL (CAAX protease family)
MITGAVMAIVVLATRSLIPAMLLHALIDTEAATAGYLLMRDDPSTGATAMRSAPA